MMRLMNFKPSLQKGLEEEEVNTKVNYLSYFFDAINLVILLLDVPTEKIRMKGRKESTKEEEMTKTTGKERMKKVRNIIILLKKSLIIIL